MNKDRIKGFAAGFIAALIAISATAFAENIEKTITAIYNNIKIVVDGKTITPKDVNGNVVEPFIVDGTTYLPVRAISEALGKEVNWDGNNNTVYVGELPEVPSTQTDLFAIDTKILSYYKNTTLAKINSEKITGGLINFFLAQPEIATSITSSPTYKSGDTLQTFKYEGETAASYLTRSALENLTTTFNAAELAVKNGLSATEEAKTEIKNYEDAFFSQFATEQDYNNFLSEYATTDSAIRLLIEKNALASIYYNHLQQSLMNVSEVDLYKEFNKNFAHVKHILVEDKETAQRIISQIKGGADFDELVEKYNIDKGQGVNGYIFTKGEMVAPFEDAAFSMKEKTYSSAPVETDYGYHILYKYPLTEDDFNAQLSSIRQSYAYSSYYSQLEKLSDMGTVSRTSAYNDYVSKIK